MPAEEEEPATSGTSWGDAIEAELKEVKETQAKEQGMMDRLFARVQNLEKQREQQDMVNRDLQIQLKEVKVELKEAKLALSNKRQ
eukprot:9244436-Karenia_brevis.AAC.1